MSVARVGAAAGSTARRGDARVLHVSVVHRADDPRIFERECRSLRDAGYDVTYAVPGPVPGPVQHGVKLVALPQRPRSLRWSQAAPVLNLVRRLRPDVVHVHDPELLAYLPAAKRLGARVVYDMHEYVSLTIGHKYYVPKPLRPHAQRAVAAAQQSLAAQCDGLVAVVDDQFELLGPSPELRVALPNYPRYSRFVDAQPIPELAADPRLKLVYIGSLTRPRGMEVMLDVMERLAAENAGATEAAPARDAVLYLGGNFYNREFEAEVRGRLARPELAGSVRLLGRIPPDDVPAYLASADVVWIAPTSGGQLERRLVPTKLYEGMAVGLAALVSNLPGRGDVVLGEQCGLAVEPGVEGHLQGVHRLLWNRPEVPQMGARGRQAVRARYSWEIIEKDLLAFYERLLAQ